NCKNVFGCAGLVRQEYCILNKKYTKEAYEALVPKIIEHMKKTRLPDGRTEWGEFFPMTFSPFAYNQSRVNEYFPLTQAEVEGKGLSQNELNKGWVADDEQIACAPGAPDKDVASLRRGEARGRKPRDAVECAHHCSGDFVTNPKGWRWSSYTPPAPMVAKSITANELPQTIAETGDDILNTAIACESTGRLFGVVKGELNFYRKNGLPLPRKHPDQRYLDRIAQRVPRALWQRACPRCQKQIWTSLAPESGANMVCRECYLAKIR
ncbi:MAG: hypothetical protein WC618_06270, partial [Patescibacteria group bacterium]